MKIGILSGTFDPVHSGHIELANIAINERGIDEVWFAPERIPRFKENVLPYKHRYQMLKIALENQPHLKIYEAKQLSHSAETLMDLIQQYPTHKFVLLLGEDAAVNIKQWESYPVIKERCSIVTFGRGGKAADTMLDHSASSKTIREQIASNQKPAHTNDEVLKYIYEHKLYQS